MMASEISVQKIQVKGSIRFRFVSVKKREHPLGLVNFD